MSPDMRAGIHEGGHAHENWLEGSKVSRIVIRPDGSGFCQGETAADPLGDARIAYGGMVALQLFGEYGDASDDDYRLIAAALQRAGLYPTPKVIKAFIASCSARLGAHMDSIEYVANELVRQRDLDVGAITAMVHANGSPLRWLSARYPKETTRSPKIGRGRLQQPTTRPALSSSSVPRAKVPGLEFSCYDSFGKPCFVRKNGTPLSLPRARRGELRTVVTGCSLFG